MNRRHFLATASAAATAPFALQAQSATARPITTNVYPWGTFYHREGRDWKAEIDAGLAEVASTGITGFEGIANSPAGVAKLAPLLQNHGLALPSLYVNSTLHDPAKAEASIDSALAIAAEAKALGATIIVTNPSPIRWGGEENKDDTQLAEQAKNLGNLGRQLREMGLVLAYHNHDVELREGAREFHHMLTATDPEDVRFCLDAHWIFRGCGDSQIALFDAVEHYADRIVELHLRQSTGGVWDEVFTMKSDIDYPRLFALLADRGLKPHLVLEQAVEKTSPHTMNAVAAHRAGYRNLSAAAG